MKKVVLTLLCGIAALTLTACGKSGSSPIVPAVSSKSGTPYKEPSGNGGVTIIGDNTETDASSDTEPGAALVYEIEDDLGGVNILRYNGLGGKVSIPSVIDGKKVLKIDEHAFRGSKVTKVVIPKTVKTIENHAFTGCTALETLTIADGVETIDDYAFSECSELSLVTLPDSIKEIGRGAFRNCPKLMLTYKGQTYTALNEEELYFIF